MKVEITNWNNYPKRPVEFKRWNGEGTLNSTSTYIARGMGRCYGDAAIGDLVCSTLGHNLILSFNAESGEICCQSGVTIHELLETFVPRGWFLPVTPGTKFVTVGGALASDVHGKNHHVTGCFGDHVSEITLITADGNPLTCGPNQHVDIFNATRGGMGLTGIIDTVTFKLQKIETSYIKQHQIKAKNLEEVFELFEENKEATYSMAWIDCLKGGSSFGRSIFIHGEHAKLIDLSEPQKAKPLVSKTRGDISMPINLPGFVLNQLSVKAFNWLYYHKNLRKSQSNIVHYDAFFYPLDSILHWNRMYGKSGFVQYQFVLPIDQSMEGLLEILSRIRKKGWGSFLAVLKLFGKQESLISFPMEGYTLALDFPIKKGLFEFLDELDEIVVGIGGRIYLSKDARMKADNFKKSYQNSEQFLSLIKKINPEGLIQSDLSKRLLWS